MKKLFAILLAVAMIMSFALIASADETEATGYKVQLQYCSQEFIRAEGGWDLINSVGCFDQTYGQSTMSAPTGTHTAQFNIADHPTKGDLDHANGADYLYVQIHDYAADFFAAGYQVSDVSLVLDGIVFDSWSLADDEILHLPVAEGEEDKLFGNYVYVYESVENGTPTGNLIIEIVFEDNIMGIGGFSSGLYNNDDMQLGCILDPESFTFSESIAVNFTISDPNDVPEDTTESTEGTTEATEATTEATEATTQATEATTQATEATAEGTAATTESTAAAVEDNTNAETGDSISVFVALMAVSAMGIAVIGKKKFN